MKARPVKSVRSGNNQVQTGDLYPVLSVKMLKKDVLRHAEAAGEKGPELLKWSLHPEIEIANRASWIFRTWADLHPETLDSLFLKIFKTVRDSENGSVIRNLTGIWVDHGYAPRYDSKILELGILLLNTSHYAIAAYANVLGMLKYACQRYPELKEEIRLTALRHPLSDESGYQKRLNDVMNA